MRRLTFDGLVTVEESTHDAVGSSHPSPSPLQTTTSTGAMRELFLTANVTSDCRRKLKLDHSDVKSCKKLGGGVIAQW